MHKVSAKRQVTIPKDLCSKAGIEVGNLVEMFEHEGRITVVKKSRGASAGVLKHLKALKGVSDQESRQDTLDKKHGRKSKVT